MTYTIKKGKHRAKPWMFAFFLKKKLSYRVSFDTSAKYFIGQDQDDTNKLFGIGFFPHHHKESARFGWRYNENLNRIELLAYCYVNGHRLIELITTIPFHVSYVLEIEIIDQEYRFTVNKEMPITTAIPFYHKKKIGYRLGCFFGGNQPAPQTITVEMKKL